MPNDMQFKLVNNADQMKKEIRKAQRQMLRQVSKVIAKKAKSNTPKRTGSLQKALGVKVSVNNKTVKAEVGYWSKSRLRKKGKKAPHAKAHFLELGTKRHIISPGIAKRGGKAVSKPSKLLSNNAGSVYGRRVNHPGTRGKKVLSNAAESSKQDCKAAAEDVAKQITLIKEKFAAFEDAMKGEDEFDV